MARKVKELRDLEIDEISLVDKGANQHAKTVIAKRHDEEENMKYFDKDQNPVDVTSLQPGDTVYDEQGNEFEMVLEEPQENPFARAEEPELAGAGVSKSMSVDELREELSKAMTDDARDEIISKAFGQLAEAEKIAKRAEAAAEGERQMRLDREYTEVAKQYNVGVAPEELGPVLKRAAEALSDEDCKVIAKALDSASTSNEMFRELGTSGTGTNGDVFSQVEKQLEGKIEKADGESVAAAISKAFAEHPELYDEYIAEQSAR